MSDYPKIDDFLDAVEDSTDQTWSSDIQHLYSEALKECVFADRVVKEMLPHEWEDWVIEGIAEHTPSEKWMSSIAPQFWSAQAHHPMHFSQVNTLLLAGCALEHSSVGCSHLGFFSKGPETLAVAKRLVNTDDETILGVLEASTKHSATVVSTLLPMLIEEGWDFNAAWENSHDQQFQNWIQRMVEVSNGGVVFSNFVAGFSQTHLEEFSQWVVNFMIKAASENRSNQDMSGFDDIFEQMPGDVAQKWVDHLSNHSPNPQSYGPLVSALLQNKQLRDVVAQTPSHEVVRRRM